MESARPGEEPHRDLGATGLAATRRHPYPRHTMRMVTARSLALGVLSSLACTTCITSAAQGPARGPFSTGAGPRKLPSKQMIPGNELSTVAPVVVTPLGNITGKFGTDNGDDAALEAFLGVPFAEPPIGELR